MTEARPGRSYQRLDRRFIEERQAPDIREELKRLDLPSRMVAEQTGVSPATVSRARGGIASEKASGQILHWLQEQKK